MKVLARNTSVAGAVFRREPLLVVGLLIFFTVNVYSQNACNINAAQTFVHCPNESAFVGISTTVGPTYTWYKNGLRLAGPLPGDGNPTSFGFALRTTNDAGHYTVERTQAGITTCIFNQLIQVYSLPAAQTLTGNGPLCNGERILTLTASEPGVTYGLLKDGGLWESKTSSGTGPLNFTVYIPDVYTVRASRESDCPGVYSYFGNVVVTGDPATATINYTTTTSANISWSGSGNFIVEYGLTGFTPGAGATAGAGTVINASSSPVNITGLTSGFTYDVYIRQLCSAPNYNSSEAKTFTTNCASITTFPHTQGFESVTVPALPACWKVYNNNNDAVTWATLSFSGRSGPKCLLLNSDYFFPSHDDYVILPPMTLTGNQRLKYWVKSGDSQTPQLYTVKVSTTNNSMAAFSNVLLTETAISNSYEEKIVNLSGYTGVTFIAIHVPPTSTKNGLFFDDFTVENIPACPGPSFVKVNSTSNSSAVVSWTGTGTFILEYGAPGFTPGTGATAGGGTIISGAVSPRTISGLAPGTSYDVYIRQNCSGSGNGFSANSPKTTLTTFFACSPTTVTACTNLNANMTAGNGVADFTGIYPVNSTGHPTPGKELLYSFTPASTGVYYIDVTASTGTVCYFYKPVSDGCGNTGWTGIARTNIVGKYPVGILQAGTAYYFLLDNYNTTAASQTFKICLATVAAPSTLNTCMSAELKNPYVPANSTKIEYLIDNAGNLIASLDFSGVSNAPGYTSLYYYVNSGALRRDNNGREYLNRNYTLITTTTTNTNPIGVTLYFTNAELQSLINDPDDGNSDVSSVTDLKITRDMAFCGPPGGYVESYLTQTGSGNYDANSKYVQFNSISNGTGHNSYYLHGGYEALFNTTIICPGDNASISMNDQGSGYIYQWQVNTGSGFANIVPSIYYSGINSSTLTINYPPTSYAGYKYRCIATGATTVTTDVRTLRFSMTWDGSENTNWEDPRNWSCNIPGQEKIPDANVDIIIPNVTNKPVINSNVSCRSVKAETGATLRVNTGFKLTITGQ